MFYTTGPSGTSTVLVNVTGSVPGDTVIKLPNGTWRNSPAGRPGHAGGRPARRASSARRARRV